MLSEEDNDRQDEEFWRSRQSRREALEQLLEVAKQYSGGQLNEGCHCPIYLSREIEFGPVFAVAGEKVIQPKGEYWGFLDLHPAAAWAHECLYVVLRKGDPEVKEHYCPPHEFWGWYGIGEPLQPVYHPLEGSWSEEFIERAIDENILCRAILSLAVSSLAAAECPALRPFKSMIHFEDKDFVNRCLLPTPDWLR